MYEMSGYIKLHRSFKNWEWYRNHTVKCVYLHLLLSANFKEDNWQGRACLRGQLITSLQHLAEALGFSVQQVRTALTHLKNTGYITVETTNRYSVITVENWDFYQNGEATSTYRAASQRTAKQTDKQQQIKNIKNTITKEVKNPSAPTGKIKFPLPQSVTDSGRYDYEQLRVLAKQRIKKRITEIKAVV